LVHYWYTISMLKILNLVFVTLGVIFFLIIIAGVYFYATDPLDLKPLFLGNDTTQSATATPTAHSTSTNPLLNESQAQALESFGIDPAQVPSTITPEQEACFIEILGEARVEEIKAGASPTATEFFRARGCL